MQFKRFHLQYAMRCAKLKAQTGESRWEKLWAFHVDQALTR